MGSRKIFNVRYRLEEARIYDETPIQAGTTTAVNSGDEAATVSVSMAFENKTSYSFNSGSSTTGGAPATLQAGIPTIVGDSIQIGPEISISSFEWGQTITNSTPIQASGSIPVPPKSEASISYGGTTGKCDVPFSYTQQDTSASGDVVVTERMDGIFKGSNSYNFHFSVENVTPRS